MAQQQTITFGTDFRDLAPFAIDQYGIDVAGDTYVVSHFTIQHLIAPSQGTLSARIEVTLPGNAVVDLFQVKVTARRADQTEAGTVSQLRAVAGDQTNQHVITVDFGTVRTVAAVRFTTASFIEHVDAWSGTEFPASRYGAPFSGDDFTGTFNRSFVQFRSDVRTERLRITLRSESSVAELMGALILVLPDAPRDLTLSLDGGRPVWSLPGPVVKGEDTALTTEAWNAENERLVDLTETFRALTGDPTDAAERTFELVLDSREAGVLALDLHSEETRRVRRARPNGREKLALSPTEEGVEDIILEVDDAPATAVAERISLALEGTFGPERRVPPTGPAPAPSPDPALPLVELQLTPERAAVVRLVAIEGLPEIDGLRLPLAAGEGGAELRLVPWQAGTTGAPESAMDDLTGEPVTLDAGGPTWTTLRLGGALVVDAANPPWVAILTTRGTATIALAEGGAAIRVGPAAGPWRSLPRLFTTDAYADLGLPVRQIGQAPDTAIPAPVTLAVAGTAATRSIDPLPGGARVTLDGFAAADPTLRLTRLGAGELTLSAVDVVYDS